ncbi:MAG: pyrroline-5-carboxylate reductase [Neisseria sp.]|nr:pyrroline-5-carboxylate reductase [Neisseria sp.]
MTIYFLGGGNMAAAIIGGLKKQQPQADVFAAERGAERRAWLEQQFGIKSGETLPALTADDILVLAVKPQDMQAALSAVKTNGALVLSVAAGLAVDTLSGWLNGSRRIVRVMPNTPAAVGLGVAGMFAAAEVSDEDRRRADEIMAASGQTVWLSDEAQMHAITGISGSGPAYVFYLLGALQNAARAQGFNDEDARRLSLATFQGAVELAAQSGGDFAQLQQNVTSKGGTTHEAIETFKRLNVAEAIGEGVAACVARSKEMAEQFK